MNDLANIKQTELFLLDNLEQIVDDAVKEGSPEKAFNWGAGILSVEKIMGKGLAKLAFLLKDRWVEFNIEDPFEDVATKYWDISLTNLKRYIRSYELLQSGDIPEAYQEKVEEMPIRELIPISTAWASGYEITDGDWKDLTEASNFGEIQEKVREIKNEEPRVSAFVIRLSRDGTLKAYAGKGDGVFIGYLEVDAAEDNETVQKAITRITSGANILVE